MTYRAYIKKDYKPEIRWVPDQPWYLRKARVLAGLVSVVMLLSAYSFYPALESKPVDTLPTHEASFTTIESPDISIKEHESIALITDGVEALTETADAIEPAPIPWQVINVKQGDNLSIIFERLGLRPSVLYQIMHSGKQSRLLKDLLPGNTLNFLIDHGQLQALRFEPNLTTALEIVRQDEGFTSNVIVTRLDHRTNEASGTIGSSLFIAGQQAGLSDNLIMQLVSIFGWDIDFAMDIRKGDKFNVVYEERYKGNTKVGEGPILAAEFINQNQSFKAVRYTSPDGDTNYFNEDGVSMRKAFLRTPVNFNRISSRFNLRRKHPLLNRIRAHKGVDYAAPTGTPIKATGDGTVLLAGRKGGYGRTVILKHGGSRTTLYAHMSSFSKKIRKGKKVKQGQIIGYVGQSGLATGPHLHYEFRVNGVHRNPLTIKLPNASGVPAKYMADFKRQTATVLARLDNAVTTKIAGQDHGEARPNTVIALDDNRAVINTVQ